LSLSLPFLRKRSAEPTATRTVDILRVTSSKHSNGANGVRGTRPRDGGTSIHPMRFPVA
jgi:hypothetical protein